MSIAAQSNELVTGPPVVTHEREWSVAAFGLAQLGLTVVFLPYAAALIGVSLMPGLALTMWMWQQAASSGLWMQALAIGVGLGATYFAFGIALMILCGLTYRALPLKVSAGIYPLRSTTTLKWGVTGALIKLVKQAFLGMATPSFLNSMFFRLMGSKVGKGAYLNSVEINDPSMLEFGEGCVVGGSARINAHSVEKGKLILSPVRLGARATIGAGAIVWAGTRVGAGAVIAARAVVSKGSVVGDNEIWGGMPARHLRNRGQSS